MLECIGEFILRYNKLVEHTQGYWAQVNLNASPTRRVNTDPRLSLVEEVVCMIFIYNKHNLILIQQRQWKKWQGAKRDMM